MDVKDKDKDQTEQQDKGFAVHDKRRIGKEDSPGAEPETPDTAAGPDIEAEERPAAEPTTDADGAKPPAEDADRRPDEPNRETDHGPRTGDRSYMPLNFTSFVMSLSTSALIYLGQIPDPVSGKTGIDLVGARQTIDLITLLKEKTAGNLTPDETGFIDAVLYDLRILFVKVNA